MHNEGNIVGNVKLSHQLLRMPLSVLRFRIFFENDTIKMADYAGQVINNLIHTTNFSENYKDFNFLGPFGCQCGLLLRIHPTILCTD